MHLKSGQRLRRAQRACGAGLVSGAAAGQQNSHTALWHCASRQRCQHLQAQGSLQWQLFQFPDTYRHKHWSEVYPHVPRCLLGWPGGFSWGAEAIPSVCVFIKACKSHLGRLVHVPQRRTGCAAAGCARTEVQLRRRGIGLYQAPEGGRRQPQRRANQRLYVKVATSSSDSGPLACFTPALPPECSAAPARRGTTAPCQGSLIVFCVCRHSKVQRQEGSADGLVCACGCSCSPMHPA